MAALLDTTDEDLYQEYYDRFHGKLRTAYSMNTTYTFEEYKRMKMNLPLREKQKTVHGRYIDRFKKEKK